MNMLRTLIAITSLAPALAFAGAPKTGEYLIADPVSGSSVPLCVAADGTWSIFYYGGGRWVYDAATKSTSFFGNDTTGADNAVILVKGATASITEWQIGGSGLYVTGWTSTFNGKNCSTGTSAVPGARLIQR